MCYTKLLSRLKSYRPYLENAGYGEHRRFSGEVGGYREMQAYTGINIFVEPGLNGKLKCLSKFIRSIGAIQREYSGNYSFEFMVVGKEAENTSRLKVRGGALLNCQRIIKEIETLSGYDLIDQPVLKEFRIRKRITPYELTIIIFGSDDFNVAEELVSALKQSHKKRMAVIRIRDDEPEYHFGNEFFRNVEKGTNC